MLPYLADRAVNPHRYPNGAGKPGFWHKARPDHAPDFVTAWRYEDADEDETQVYSVIDKPATLVWMANYGAIELNPWTSRIDVAASAHLGPHRHRPRTGQLLRRCPDDDAAYRTALEHLDVLAAAKVTGKRGVQIWVPVADGYTFDDTRAWVETISRAIGATVPEMVSWAWAKSERGGRARLDYTQNAINKTLVAPFSTRPVPGAPVSMPIVWDELDDPDLRPDSWDIGNALERVTRHGDPLAELIGVQQTLPAVT